MPVSISESCSSSSNSVKTMPVLYSRRSTGIASGMSPQRNFYQFVCIVFVCIICYYNSTKCGLVFDDISAIRDNKDLRPTTPWRNIFLNDFWGTPMRKEQSHKSYRPLTVLTFRANYWMHVLEPFGYHFVNVILHIIVCLMWRRVCRQLLLHCACPVITKINNAISCSTSSAKCRHEGESVAQQCDNINSCSFLAALLFAVHPIHTEAVTGVVGRAELLSSIFYLAAFLIYCESVVVSSAIATRSASVRSHVSPRTQWLLLFSAFIVCLLCSMLCKEQGITIAGICVAYEVFIVQGLRPSDLWLFVLHLFDEQKTLLGFVMAASPSSSSPKALVGKKSGAATAAVNHRGVTWNVRTLVKRIGFLFVTTVALLVCRVYVMGSQLPVFTRFDNPASASDTPQRQLTYSYLIYLNIWLLLYPCDLCCDWTMGTVPLIRSFTDVRNVTTLATFVGLSALVVQSCRSQYSQKSRVLLMCLAWIILPFIPASNIFFPVGFVVAERILYMPSMGFCLLIAYGYSHCQQLLANRKIASMFLKAWLILLLLSHIGKTLKRNEDWRTEHSLFMSGIHVNGRNAKLFNNVGHALENEGRFPEALLYFQQAVQIQPDDIGAHINVGRTYSNLKMYKEAEMAYVKAKALFPKIKPGETYQARIAPNHLNVFINLANLIAKNQTRLEEADYLYRQAISMRADYVQAYINRGDILMKLNRTAQAQEVYEKALLYDSENADIYYNLGVVFLEQGKAAQANVYFNKAIELFPDHEQALLNSAILLQEMGGNEARQLSRERLYKVLDKDANNEKVYFNLGMLAMDESNLIEAEQFFKRAIHIKPQFRSALFNLALLLADANRALDAVPYLNQLIRHHPDHIKGLILLGDIYINHIKDLDAAESCYRSILKYEPHNVQGVHNLCVVYVERKHLAKAEACLKYVHFLAPNEDYILRHLEIVHARLQKIAKLPSTATERQAAFTNYNPNEFAVSKDGKKYLAAGISKSRNDDTEGKTL